MTRPDAEQLTSPLDDWAPSCYCTHQGQPCQDPAAWHETVSCHRCRRQRWSLTCEFHHAELLAGRARCTEHHPALMRCHASERL